jgi:murein L,D-transpeptidase YafK
MKQPPVCLIRGFRRFLLLLVVVVGSLPASAQLKPEPGKENLPQNIKVLEEHKDKNGNIVRTIQYYQNGARIIETRTVRAGFNYRVPINPDTMNKDSVSILVNKAQNVLEVYYRRRRIRSYQAVFGPKPLVAKCVEGDRCTPEGAYRIKLKKPQSKYHKFMLLDYPNDSSIVRFNRMKAQGLIPQTARMGGDVGIHGIWQGGDDVIEMGMGWTDGCVAIKNKDIDDLYPLVGVGTPVIIRK